MPSTSWAAKAPPEMGGADHTTGLAPCGPGVYPPPWSAFTLALIGCPPGSSQGQARRRAGQRCAGTVRGAGQSGSRTGRCGLAVSSGPALVKCAASQWGRRRRCGSLPVALCRASPVAVRSVFVGQAAACVIGRWHAVGVDVDVAAACRQWAHGESGVRIKSAAVIAARMGFGTSAMILVRRNMTQLRCFRAECSPDARGHECIRVGSRVSAISAIPRTTPCTKSFNT